MCMVSNIGDIYGKKWGPPFEPPLNPFVFPAVAPEITKAEFDALKREVLELKKLLRAAKKFDQATGQPDCEMGEKIAIIRKVAEAVGVNLDDLFGISPPGNPKSPEAIQAQVQRADHVYSASEPLP